jgi:UDP-N-acetylmuramoylalanine--D-glutamate ligase
VNAPLLVYGLGRSGSAVVARARAQGSPVGFIEARATGGDVDAATRAGAIRWPNVAAALQHVPAPTCCVAAPGVPIDHPDLVTLRDAGIETIGEVTWVLREPHDRSVGITGTAGKGSVTRWLTDTLTAAGIDAVAGGNIDPALAAVARPAATLVIELSSFQLERASGIRPDVAVVLNLGSDHLDRHGTLEAYHAAKRSLIASLEEGETFVGNGDDARVAAWLDASRARVRRYGLQRPADAWWERSSGWLWLSEAPLLPRGELQQAGDHQVGNALAVALAAEALGVDRQRIAEGLAAFRGLPGRYAPVGRLGGVTFVEDSIATRPLSVAAALRTTPAPVVWIAGGSDKGAQVSEVADALRDRVVLTLGIGASGARFAAAAAAYSAAEVIDDADGAAALARAVARGFEVLHERYGGGTVLLAPLAASFDQFRDYGERAARFREAVHALAASQAAAGVAWIPSS